MCPQQVFARSPSTLGVVLATAALVVLAGQATAQDNGLEKIKHKVGPCTVQLGAQAKLEVPAGFLFIEEAQMADFARLTQNTHSPAEKGALIEAEKGWFVVFSFEDIGYVKDDEKDNLKADETLKNMQAGQLEDNTRRKSQGLPTLTILGWAKAPFFDQDTRNLTWAINLKTDGGGSNINYESRILGRRGVMRATLVVDPEVLDPAVKRYNEMVKKQFAWTAGESYAEFKKGDRIAEYGLAGLLAGGTLVVLAKSGWLTKLIKPIIIGIVAIGAAISAFFKKLFRRGQAAE